MSCRPWILNNLGNWSLARFRGYNVCLVIFHFINNHTAVIVVLGIRRKAKNWLEQMPTHLVFAFQLLFPVFGAAEVEFLRMGLTLVGFGFGALVPRFLRLVRKVPRQTVMAAVFRAKQLQEVLVADLVELGV